MTFETFDQSDEETWPDQKKDKDKYKEKDNHKANPSRKHLQRAPLETCDLWDTDYISDNWELDFLTIFVTWQSRVTLDSIRISCDVSSSCSIGDTLCLRLTPSVKVYHHNFSINCSNYKTYAPFKIMENSRKFRQHFHPHCLHPTPCYHHPFHDSCVGNIQIQIRYQKIQSTRPPLPASSK